jgi:hypothetical protein
LNGGGSGVGRATVCGPGRDERRRGRARFGSVTEALTKEGDGIPHTLHLKPLSGVNTSLTTDAIGGMDAIVEIGVRDTEVGGGLVTNGAVLKTNF